MTHTNIEEPSSSHLNPAELRITMTENLRSSIEHAALKRGMTASNFAKMAIVERLEDTDELSQCDGIACNGICDGNGNVRI